MTGAVIRHFAAPFDADDLDAALPEFAGRREDVDVVSLTAEGQDRVVLEEEEPVAESGPATRSSTRRFWRAHASRYPIRPSQVAVIGSSA